MKNVKITVDHAHASPDGIRVVKYTKGFVFSLPDGVADLLVRNKQAEETQEQPTESQAVPAVENVALPGETVTGGGYGDTRDPAVMGNAVEFVTNSNSTRHRVSPVDAPEDPSQPHRVDTAPGERPPEQRVTQHAAAPTDKPVPLEDTKTPQDSKAPDTTTKPSSTRQAAVKPPAQ